MLLVGIDWAEAEHAVCLLDAAGAVLRRLRVAHSAAGFRRLRAAVAEAESAPAAEHVALERAHGLLVDAHLEAGYTVYGLNPKAVERYRTRTRTAGAKTDPADAELLARILLTDRARHRPLRPGSPHLAAIRALARDERASRDQRRLLNPLRQDLLEVFPQAPVAFPRLTDVTALAFLDRWPAAAAARLDRAELAVVLREQQHGWPGADGGAGARRAHGGGADRPAAVGPGQGRRHSFGGRAAAPAPPAAHRLPQGPRRPARAAAAACARRRLGPERPRFPTGHHGQTGPGGRRRRLRRCAPTATRRRSAPGSSGSSAATTTTGVFRIRVASSPRRRNGAAVPSCTLEQPDEQAHRGGVALLHVQPSPGRCGSPSVLVQPVQPAAHRVRSDGPRAQTSRPEGTALAAHDTDGGPAAGRGPLRPPRRRP